MRKKILLATIAFLFGTLLAWAGGTPSLPLNYQARIINGKFYVVRMLASPDPAPQGTFINSRGLRVDGAGTLYAISPAMAASPTIINSILGVAVDANGYLIVSVTGLAIITQTIASGTVTLGNGSTQIASGACSSVVTLSAPGVLAVSGSDAITDNIQADFPSDPTGTTGFVPPLMLTIVKWATHGNVNFKECNNTASPITPTAITFPWRVTR